VNAHNILGDYVTLALIQRNIMLVAIDPKKREMLVLVAFFLQLFLLVKRNLLSSFVFV
jgi:hypothetical protein